MVYEIGALFLLVPKNQYNLKGTLKVNEKENKNINLPKTTPKVNTSSNRTFAFWSVPNKQEIKTYEEDNTERERYYQQIGNSTIVLHLSL